MESKGAEAPESREQGETSARLGAREGQTGSPCEAGSEGTACTKLFIQGISKNTTVCFY